MKINRPKSNQWIDAKKRLPREGEYVLIHLTKDNWGDSSDEKGVYFKVAKLVKGISVTEREQMEAGKLPNPDHYFTGGKKTLRSKVYCWGDEEGNNRVPFAWSEFGVSKYWGQEVDYWMPIGGI